MFRKSALISLSALLLAMPGQTETLQEALDQAFQTNPALAAQRADVGVAREQLNQARGARAPTVELSGSATFESLDSNQPIAFNTGENTLASAQLRATLPVYTGGQINAGIAQAKAGISAANAQFDGVAQDLILNVVTAYVDVIRDREAIRIRANSVALLEEQLRAATDRFEVGFATRTDVKQAEARLQGARASLAGAEAQLEASLSIYELFVGQPAGDLTPVPNAPTLPENFATSLQAALADNPDLKALRDAERVAEQGVKSAQGATRPSLSIVGSASVQETIDQEATAISPTMGIITLPPDNYRDTQLRLLAQGSVPLFQGGVLRSRIRAARLERDQARLQTVNAERQITASVAQAWYSNIAAEQAIIASERQVEAAEIAYEGAQEELSVGTRTTLDVLDQEQQLLEARLGLINARRDAYVASHQLLRAMGKLAL
nr:TolC family outer membrane protein [Hyphomonas sp. Mor2]